MASVGWWLLNCCHAPPLFHVIRMLPRSHKCPSQLYNCQIHCMIYRFNLTAIIILCLSYTFIHIWKSDLHLIWNYFLKLLKENILSAIPLTKGPIVFWPWLPVFMDQGDSRWFKRAHYAMTQDDSRWPTMTYWGLLGVTRVLAPQCDWESKQVDIGWSG